MAFNDDEFLLNRRQNAFVLLRLFAQGDPLRRASARIGQFRVQCLDAFLLLFPLRAQCAQLIHLRFQFRCEFGDAFLVFFRLRAQGAELARVRARRCQTDIQFCELGLVLFRIRRQPLELLSEHTQLHRQIGDGRLVGFRLRAQPVDLRGFALQLA